jgi:hypothetical protein
MRTTLLLSFIAIATASNAQFSSGFEAWNDTLPTDWIGSKTNINLDSIGKVIVNPHGGQFAVRLQNHTNNNKRFTTLPMHVDSGTVYDYSIWARGHGDVHVSLFDERIVGSGYAPYTAYVTVNNNTDWELLTTSVICTHTSDIAEFIIGCRNTFAPEHLVLDDVNIAPGAPPQQRSIHDIQYTTDAGGNSPENGNIIITGGIVTGIDTITPNGYYIQYGPGPWCGVYVFDSTHPVNLGDSVTFQAMVQEYHNNTELLMVTNFSVHGNFPVPAPQLLTALAAQDEQWEGVLCHVDQATCTAAPGGAPWTVNDGTDLLIDSLMFAYPAVVGEVYNVTGCIGQYDADRLLYPRFGSDVEIFNSVAEVNAPTTVSVYPNPATDVLNIKLGNSATTSANYTLTDALGQTLRAGKLNSTTTLYVGGLPRGLYFVRVQQGVAVRVARFTKN